MNDEPTPFGIIHGPGKTTFDSDEREEIRQALIRHMERMGFRVPTLADKIGLDWKTMYRFLKGKSRTKDFFVQCCFEYCKKIGEPIKSSGSNPSHALGESLTSFFAPQVGKTLQGQSIEPSTRTFTCLARLSSENDPAIVVPYSSLTLSPVSNAEHFSVHEIVINKNLITSVPKWDLGAHPEQNGDRSDSALFDPDLWRAFKDFAPGTKYEGVAVPGSSYTLFVLRSTLYRLPKIYSLWPLRQLSANSMTIGHVVEARFRQASKEYAIKVYGKSFCGDFADIFEQ